MVRELRKFSEVIWLIFKIFLILLFLGIILPNIFNKIFELFPLKDTTDYPRGNSTLVMSYVTESKRLLYVFKKLIISYFSYK